MIIITGATGKLGSAIVERLLEKLPAQQIAVSVRDTAKAKSFADRGVRVRQADFAAPETLAHAFEGATQVLVISSNSSGEAAVEHHRNAIDAAKAAGARRVLYTSHMGSNPNSAFAPMRDHAATEAYLESAGIAFTSLRNGFYTDSGLMLMGQALQTGEFSAPEDGPVSWTTHEDLADAAVVALTEEGRLDGITPGLTASEALDLDALAQIAGEILGRPVTRTRITDEQNRANMAARHMPPHVVDLMAGLFVASRNHEFSAVDPKLKALLGRDPITVKETLQARLAN